MNIFEWLSDKGYRYTWSFELGSRTPDIIAYKENEVVALEIKKKGVKLTTAIGQCLHYLRGANKAYVVLPKSGLKSISDTAFSLLKEKGIGIIQLDGEIRITLEAQFFPRNNEKLIEILKKSSLDEKSGRYQTPKMIKSRIIGVLKLHPEGLTIKDVARLSGFHRHTITKYLYELEGAEKVRMRDFGPLKLCFLNAENGGVSAERLDKFLVRKDES